MLEAATAIELKDMAGIGGDVGVMMVLVKETPLRLNIFIFATQSQQVIDLGNFHCFIFLWKIPYIEFNHPRTMAPLDREYWSKRFDGIS